MERYDITGLTNLTVADHAGRIEAWLQARGIQTAGVSVGFNDETGIGTVFVTADQDPRQLLIDYTPTPTAAEVARALVMADARAVIQAIAAKPRADRTPVERALLGLATAVRELTD